MSSNKRGTKTELGEMVAKHRKAQGSSSRDVARRAGIDIHTMIGLEQGYYANPTPITLRGVSTALNIPILDLFHAAGYVTPYDVLHLVTNPAVEPILEEQDAKEARSRYIEELIDKHGLDYTGPEYTDTLIDE